MRSGCAALSVTVLLLATLCQGLLGSFSASNRSSLLSTLAPPSEDPSEGTQPSQRGQDEAGTLNKDSGAEILVKLDSGPAGAQPSIENTVTGEGKEQRQVDSDDKSKQQPTSPPPNPSVTDGRAVTSPSDQQTSPELAAKGQQASEAQQLVHPAVELDAESPPAPQIDSQEEEEEDRHNFALAKDGAKIVAVNKEAKKASALLDNDADTFLKNECKADKWVVLELSQVAKMDTLLISQNELYSSRIKEFEVKGRQTHPRTEGTDYGKQLNSSAWQLLGRFNASNAKGTQAFRLERPTWTKYLQLHILSHHGMEAVCALNDVCVFGKSAAEDLEARLNFEQPGAEEGEPKLEAALPEGEPLVVEVPKISLQNNDSKDLLANGPPGTTLAAESIPAHIEASVGASEATKVPKNQSSQSNGSAVSAASSTLQGEAMKLADNDSLAKPPVLPAEPGIQKRLPSEKEIIAEKTDEKPESLPTEDSLPVNSASSAATRHGGSVYDMIVQELKAIKLAQKAGAQTLSQLQKNMTAVMGGFAFELDLLAAEVRRVSPSRPALLPAGADDLQCVPGSNGTRGSPGDGLDFREGQCLRQPSPEGVQVVKPATELELLQLEVAALREMVLQSKRQADSMLLALAASLLGGIGFNLMLGYGSSSGSLKPGGMLLIASIPLGLASCFWLRG